MAKALCKFVNEKEDSLTIFEDHIEINKKPLGFLSSWPPDAGGDGIEYITFDNLHIKFRSTNWLQLGWLTINVTSGRSILLYFRDNLAKYQDARGVSKKHWNEVSNLVMKAKVEYEKPSNQGTVVQGNYIKGDYVDDRDTIINDSVVSKSNIGSSGEDKFAKLEKLAKMKKEGLIDDNEFKQMKKEILGK